MSIRHSGAVTEGLRTLFQYGAMGAWTDGQLVARFASDRGGGEAAFRVLLHRHGPMVLGVCHRVLGDAHLAEDAFQATFLVLVKKAGTLRNRDLLANWLYGVAHRVANKARVEVARRRVVERRAAEQATGPGGDPDRAELRSVIDEEIRRLPERYRLPLVMCYLEGMKHHEVALRLGCPVGTIESRLSRARERLHSRLIRRGLAPTSTALAALLMPSNAPAAFAPLVEATLRSAGRISACLPGVSGLVSFATLADRAPRSLVLAGPGAIGAALLSAGLVVAGLGLSLASTPSASQPIVPAVAPPPRPVASVPPQAPEAPLAPLPKRNVSKSSPVRDPVLPTRSPSARAMPLRGIRIDGRLDDWPKDLPRYPIRNQVTNNSTYGPAKDGVVPDPDAYFTVGYDPGSGLIYLAVVVRDQDLVASPGHHSQTDAVEVYVDGNFSDRAIPVPLGAWPASLEASTMPALQYAAVPGPVPAYDDRWDANPSLVYGRIDETDTKMRYRRSGDVTTYEWAVQTFDRYPDRPTRLRPGQSIGFDVAVVDRDPDRDRPVWMSWGPPPRVFKGIDAGELGELLLGDDP